MTARDPSPALEATSSSMSTSETTSDDTAGRPRWRRWVAIAAGAALIVAGGRLLPVDRWLEAVRGAVADLGPWGPLVYGLFYVAAALAFVPGSAITLAAGTLFGIGLGTLVVSLASTTAAALAFPLARTLMRSRVESLARDSRSFGAMDDAIADGGWRIVGLLRLSPVVPFSALNYLLGLTRVRYVPAVLVSWVAMLPGTLLYVWLGAAGAEAAAGREKGWKEWTLLGVGLLATLAVTVALTRMARARMAERDVDVEAA